MASAPTHIVAAAAIATGFYRPLVPRHLWLTAAALAVAPDIDVIGFRLGISYGDLLGHRGLTHSIPVAAVLSALLVLWRYRDGAGPLAFRRVWLFLFLVTASHGILDAFTNGGLGVAFFAPFTGERFFFPARPIEVSPLSLDRFLTGRGLAILASEALWVWIPALVVGSAILWYRRRRGSLRPG